MNKLWIKSNKSSLLGAPATRISLAVDSGFTLVETLVAISLLLIAIGGPLFAVSQALSSAIYARDQVTAFYLAQDAVEYIRNVRDNNALSGTPGGWLTGLDNCQGGNTCRIDTTIGNPYSATVACSGDDGCPPLNYDSNSGVYSYDPGTASPYTRSIYLQNVDGSQSPIHEKRLIVTILWDSNVAGAKRTFNVIENLTDWEK